MKRPNVNYKINKPKNKKFFRPFLGMLFLIVVIASACNPKATARRTQDDSPTQITTPYGTPAIYLPPPPLAVPAPNNDDPSSGGSDTSGNSGNSGGCFGAGIGDQVSEYYTTPNIIQKGKPTAYYPWSSKLDPRLTSSSMQNTFITDARFNVRVLVHEGPSKGSSTYDNKAICNYMPVGYTKLRVKVGLRVQGATAPFATHWFNGIPTTQDSVPGISVNSCSEIHKFNVAGISHLPIILDVIDVKWDFSCIFSKNSGNEQGCPWDAVWVGDCYEISLQYATDYTRDIPQ